MNKENEIDVSSIFKSIIDNRNFILLFSALFSVISLFYSLTLDDIYTSKITLKYSDNFSIAANQSRGSLLDAFSLQTTQHNKFVLERMKSRDFFSTLYKDDIFLKNLMAYKLYDKKSKNNYYLPDTYNLEDKENPWTNGKPSLSSSHEKFVGSNLQIEKNRESGLMTLALSHQSPYIAKEWSDKVLIEINTYISGIDRYKANVSYSFLSEQLNKKPVAAMAKTISDMLAKELRTLMLSEIVDTYVFEIIENSVVSERKSYPFRLMVVFFTGLISFLFCCLLVVFLSFNDKKIIISLIPPKFKIQ